MNRKQVFFIFLLTVISSSITKAETADWTILTIMQADNNLAPFAVQNINDIQKNISGNKVNKLIYWHRPRSQQRLKCKIKQNGIAEEEIIEIKTAPNMEQEVVHAMQWAVTKYPAKYYMLNLWDHGTGVIDQSSWGAKIRQLFRSNEFSANSWLETPGFGTLDDRGILYSDSTRTYMNNQQLASACKQIKENILKRNLDILGMDACVMAMVEIAYQVKDYANFLVSSQNLEPGRGWNYGAFIKQICSNPTTTLPLKVAQSIVDTYAQYYSGRYTFYTLSTIDLSEIDELKKNIDHIVSLIFSAHTGQIPGIFSAVKQAAMSSIKFDSFEFIDLYSFYSHLNKMIKNKITERKRKTTLQPFTYEQEQLLASLQNTLETSMHHVGRVVKSNRVGPNFAGARGISIYYPQGNFHPSYARTRFATDTSWAYLVQAANLQQVALKPHKKR